MLRITENIIQDVALYGHPLMPVNYINTEKALLLKRKFSIPWLCSRVISKSNFRTNFNPLVKTQKKFSFYSEFHSTTFRTQYYFAIDCRFQEKPELMETHSFVV